jgi:hypothetical protein
VYTTNFNAPGLVFQYDVQPGGLLAAKNPESVPSAGFPTQIAVSPPPRLPTSKDQCKNGGWRNFPDFKNEGQCVSFVATGGKKQP